MASDEVERRAAELRAQREADAREELQQLADVESARSELARRFVAALGAQTNQPVTCLNASEDDDEWPRGASISFSVLSRQRRLDQAVCHIGVETIEGPAGDRRFSYYFLPAHCVQYPDGATPVELKGVPQGEVITQAVKLTVELMAQHVSDGGRIGSVEQVASWQQEEFDRKAAAELALRRKSARHNRRGCLAVVIGFLALCMLIGVLDNLAECSALVC